MQALSFPCMPEMNPLRVLIAIADPCSRAVLRSLVQEKPELELAGVAIDADEAAALVCSRRPGVVILDATIRCGGAPRALRAVSLVSPAPTTLILSSIAGSRCLIPPTEGVIEHVAKGNDSLHEVIEAIVWAARQPAAGSSRPADARVDLSQKIFDLAAHTTKQGPPPVQ